MVQSLFSSNGRDNIPTPFTSLGWKNCSSDYLFYSINFKIEGSLFLGFIQVKWCRYSEGVVLKTKKNGVDVNKRHSGMIVVFTSVKVYIIMSKDLYDLCSQWTPIIIFL